ncbi:GntR family transcriptional regulator [Oryzicola mucosus]|uniref:GntR family transcriptional regulator n=1 Tax=Oryzicola mucosus TaxID=2767425 RepID=A0A8J6PVG3_9HYPH|nr:GntR family transcriptional regulator [Oryzicola mucosus]
MADHDTNSLLVDVVPVLRETVQNRVHQQLRHLLMVGRFQPGQALKIHDLAEVFGTSAQPVRESIRQLVAERALEALPNRSARVPLMDDTRLEDLRRTRLALEGLAAEISAERATEEDIEALARIVDEEVRADEDLHVESSVNRNLEFHFRLYRISGSTVLLPIVEGLWLQVGPNIRRAAENFDARDGRGAELHIRTVAELRKGNVKGVRRAIEDDINRFFDLLVKPRPADAAPAKPDPAINGSYPSIRAL